MIADVEVLEPISANGIIINTSEGGLRIAVDKELHEGMVCVLSIQKDDEQRIEVGRVAWSRQCTDGFLVGLSLMKDL